MAKFIVLAAALMLSAQALAADTLTCVEEYESDSGELVDVGTVTITMGKDGNAETVKISRKSIDDIPGFEQTFSRSRGDSVVHDIHEGIVDYTDEETGEVYYAFNVKKYEYITAANRQGQKINIHVDDHSYAGFPGSRLEIESKGVKVDTLNLSNVSCTGTKRFTAE